MATLGRIASLFGFIAVFLICAILALSPRFATAIFGNQLVDGSQPNSISMVDPSGKNAQNDYVYSQANLNNSQANVNNASADAITRLSVAQADKTSAEACDIRNDCFAAERASNASLVNNLLLMIVGIIFAFVVGFILLAKRST